MIYRIIIDMVYNLTQTVVYFSPRHSFGITKWGVLPDWNIIFA